MLTIPSSHGKSTVLAMVKIYPCFDVHEYSSSHTFQTLKWLKSLWFIMIPTVQTLDSVRTSSREFKCVLMMNLLVGGGGQVCCCYSLPVEIFTIIILDIPEEITASGSCCLLSTVLIDIVHLTLCTTDYCNVIIKMCLCVDLSILFIFTINIILTL